MTATEENLQELLNLYTTLDDAQIRLFRLGLVSESHSISQICESLATVSDEMAEDLKARP